MCFFRENAPDQLHLAGSNALLLVFVRGIAIENHGHTGSRRFSVAYCATVAVSTVASLVDSTRTRTSAVNNYL